VHLTGEIKTYIKVQSGKEDRWLIYDGDDGINPIAVFNGIEDVDPQSQNSMSLIGADFVEIRDILIEDADHSIEIRLSRTVISKSKSSE